MSDPSDPECSVPNGGTELLQAVGQFLAASTWSESRRLLEQRPGLLGERVPKIIEQVAEGLDPNQARLVRRHADLVRRCRADGIPKGFAATPAADSKDLDLFAISLPEWEQLRVAQPDAANRPELSNRLGRGLYRLYLTKQDPGLLRWVVSALSEAVGSISSCGPERLAYLGDLVGIATELSARADQHSRSEELDASIDAFTGALVALEAGAPVRPTVLNGAGYGRLLRYQRTGQVADLREAIRLLQLATEEEPAGSAIRPQLLANLGRAWHTSYLREKEPSDLENAVRILFEAVDTTPTPGAVRAERLSELGLVLSDQYRQGHDLSHLDGAVRAYTQAAAETTDQFLAPLDRFFELGISLTEEYQRTSERTILSRACDVFERLLKAIGVRPAAPESVAECLYYSGMTLAARYRRFREGTDLTRAVAQLQQAVGLRPDTVRLHGFGAVLLESYLLTHESGTLDRAVDISRQAASKAALDPGAEPAVRGATMGLQGQALRRRYERDQSVSDLTEAVASLEVAASLDAGQRSAHLNTLSAALLDRYERNQAIADLKRATEAAEEGARITFDVSLNKAVVTDNLARCRKAHYERTSAPEDLRMAIQAYRDAVQFGVGTDPERALVSARNWLEWAMNRSSWEEAIEASDHATQAIERLYHSQLLLAGTDVWLHRGRGLAAAGAYALVKTGRNDEAVLALERDRARTLSAALERDRAHLESIVSQARPDLVQRYAEAVDVWNSLRTADFVPSGDTTGTIGRIEAVRKAHAAFEESILTIRQLAGCERFLEPVGIGDVRAACREAQIVYIFATKWGGCALIVPRDGVGPIASVALPTLTESNLIERLQGIDRLNPSSYLMAYSAFRDVTEDRDALARWFDALDTTTRWLWETMGPIVTALNCAEPAILIPTGWLGLLPLHAAWTEDSARPTGRCYAMDLARLRYAPNARVLLNRPPTLELGTPETLLLVEEPRPVTDGPLPNAHGEAAVAAASFPAVMQLPHEKALRDEVLRLLPDCSVAHFACHGRANFETPLESSLVMARDDLLTVRQVMNLRLTNARLAVLSACEAGIPGPKLPDELVGLPAGFLQAGFVGVIAPLWYVEDSSTAMLMIHYYMHWRGTDHLAPADALACAQAWVRDTTNAEKVLYFRGIDAGLSSESSHQLSHFLKGLCDKLESRPTRNHDYDHPMFWAAFEYVGS